jgi:hypothetical protein
MNLYLLVLSHTIYLKGIIWIIRKKFGSCSEGFQRSNSKVSKERKIENMEEGICQDETTVINDLEVLRGE